MPKKYPVKQIIYITKAQKKFLVNRKKKTGIPESETVRQAIDFAMAKRAD